MDIKNSIVAILNSRDKIVGTGFLASQNLVVTCAHVIVTAGAIDGDMVQVRFNERTEKLNALVVPEYWRDVDKGDVAVLRLENVPDGTSPLPLGNAAGSAGHDFYAYGYATVTDVQGIGARGKIVDIVDSGRLVQLSSQEPDHGMSGGPVLDEQRRVVVGMVTKGKGFVDKDKSIRNIFTSFAISIEAISGVCPNLLAELSRDYPATLFSVPPVPNHYMPRFEVFALVRNAILAGQSKTIAIVGASRKTGLVGMGGVGKTVLATALAHDEYIRNAFPDGIIWITLGQEPNLTVRQSQVGEALGEKNRVFQDPQQGRAVLEQIMAKKSFLLILDDVWDELHVAAFDCIGPNCQLLITTRNSSIAAIFQAKQFAVGILSRELALELLARASEQSLDTLPNAAYEIIRVCGYLPLAITMIGSMVRHNPENWDYALERLQKADLVRIRRKSILEYSYPDLFRALYVSVEALPPKWQERYYDFSVFPEDTPIPRAVFYTFWSPFGLDNIDVDEILTAFLDRSLIHQDINGWLSLHDLQHDYVRAHTQNIKKVHERLIRSYEGLIRHNTKSDFFGEGPNDGYFYQKIILHLIGAGRARDAIELLFNFEWIKKKLLVSDVNALISDYHVALEYITQEQPNINYRQPYDQCLILLRGTLSISANILSSDKEQLAAQLIGRLSVYPYAVIQKLIVQASGWHERSTWLCPVTASLIQPDPSLILALEGHDQRIMCAIPTPDNKLIVSTSFDGTIKVWNLAVGKELISLNLTPSELVSFDMVHGTCSCLALTPDSRFIVSSHNDMTLRLWHIGDGQAIHIKRLRNARITSLVLADKAEKVIGGGGNKLIIWSLKSPHEEIETVTTEFKIDFIASISGRLRLLVVSGSNIIIYDLEKRVIEWRYKVPVFYDGKGYCDISFFASTRDGKLLLLGYKITGNAKNTIKLLNTTNQSIYSLEIDAFYNETADLCSLAVSPDGAYAIAGFSDGTIHIWDTKEATHTKSARTLKAGISPVTGLAVTSDGKNFISISGDHVIKEWRSTYTNLQKYTAINQKRSGAINTVLAIDEETVLSASADGKIEFRDIHGDILHTFNAHASEIIAVALNRDKTKALTVSRDADLRLWDLKSYQEIHKTIKGLFAQAICVKITPDGKRLVFSRTPYSNTVNVYWDLYTENPLFALAGHEAAVNFIDVFPDGTKVVSASEDKTIKVWNFRNSDLIATLEGHDDTVKVAKVTPDGRFIISASQDLTIRCWDLASPMENLLIKGHKKTINDVVSDHANRYIASASEDRTVKLWDFDSGACLATFHGDAPMMACAFTEDAQMVLAGDNAGNLHILRIIAIDNGL